MHDAVVVAREAGARVLPIGGLAGVGVPGGGQVGAVSGGQEVVGAAADHVEAERAAVAAAVDRLAAGDGGAELALDPLHAGQVPEGVAQLGDPGVGLVRDRRVDADDDLVGGRVDRPSRTGGGDPVVQRPGDRAQLGGAVVHPLGGESVAGGPAGRPRPWSRSRPSAGAWRRTRHPRCAWRPRRERRSARVRPRERLCWHEPSRRRSASHRWWDPERRQSSSVLRRE